jgi:hypothetical protein
VTGDGRGPGDARHTVEWRLAGGDRVALVVTSGTEVPAFEGSARIVHVAEVVVDLRQHIVLQGTCAVVITACELLRFTREVGELLAGDAELATLRSYGEAASLVLAASGRDACLSGFIGHSFLGSLSSTTSSCRQAPCTRPTKGCASSRPAPGPSQPIEDRTNPSEVAALRDLTPSGSKSLPSPPSGIHERRCGAQVAANLRHALVLLHSRPEFERRTLVVTRSHVAPSGRRARALRSAADQALGFAS